jgi:beta-lactamase class A
VVRPSDGRAAIVDGDRVFYAASLFKLAVLYEAGLRLSRGELRLDDVLEISEEDLAQDPGRPATRSGTTMGSSASGTRWK